MEDVEHSWLGPPRCVEQGGYCLLWCPGRVGEQGRDVQLGNLLHEVEQARGQVGGPTLAFPILI